MVFKLLALGIKKFFKDSMNIFDSIIVFISLFELLIFGTS